MRLTVERLGHRGDGVAEGIFIPRVLPGEVVEGEVEDGRMPAPRIVTAAPERVSPPCRHYRACGGCALQHASDGFVANWKQDVVQTALAAQGLSAPMRPMHISPPATRRRATLAGRRLKTGAMVGFHARASDVLTEVPDCRVLHPGLVAALPALEAVTFAGASRKGALALAVTLSETGVDLAVRGGKPLDGPLRARLADIAAAHGLARLAWDSEVVVTRAPPIVSFGSARVVPPPGAFLQATPEGEAALLSAVREAVGAPRRVADLFAGCGTFALPLADSSEVYAVEGDDAMRAALDAGWRGTPGLRKVTTETRDLFRRPMDSATLRDFDAVVIDPPRAGARAQTAELARAGVPVIAALSCNPASFARDAAQLVSGGYRLDWVQVIDQFRWSPHVELAARLSSGHTAPERS
ncbi:class I SAM-dependent RNA methyltransferase [Rhodobacteraceae bacterium WD3A24]|nr:class I SAM-dependent RNA methyltransferase [Rhodobacteraceae bacterium WD3A24]